MATGTLLLERYKIVESIGEGGFSSVVKAFDTKMERVVAIKTIPAGRQRAIRALREAKTVALLNHPGIVTLYEFEQLEDSYHLVMEFIEGRDLASILDKFVRLPIDLALAITIQVCDALSFAHKNDVIHRDIKPGNLRILEDGRVKVMDFGIARLRSAAKTSGLTSEGEVVGTFAYMSPEQASGEMVDERSDIFSLGVLLYEMVAGRLPFVADTPAGTIYKILNEEPTPVDELGENIPSALNQVINKAIAKYPEDRFESSADLKSRLERFQHENAQPWDTVAALMDELKEPPVVAERSSLENLRARLASRLRQHQDTFVATGFATGSAIVASWSGGYLPMLDTPIFAFLPVFVFFLSLLLPPAGLAALFAMISVGVWQISPLLGGATAGVLLVYWLTLGRNFSHIALLPFIVPSLAWLNIPFVFPLAVGVVFSPLLAAFLAGAGVLILALAEVIGQINYAWSISVQTQLVAAEKFSGAPTDIADLLSFFSSQPFLLGQAIIWATAAWLTGFLKSLRVSLNHWYAMIVGFCCLLLGYRLLPVYLKIEYDFEQLFMQPVILSLIILFVFVLFFFHFAKRPRA